MVSLQKSDLEERKTPAAQDFKLYFQDYKNKSENMALFS
jgi:hypothetical protein